MALSRIDVYSLAALSAANFGAVEAMAKIVGQEEFALLFHKGETESLYFSKVNEELLIITVFGKKISLGLLRMKVADVIEKIRRIWKSRMISWMLTCLIRREFLYWHSSI